MVVLAVLPTHGMTLATAMALRVFYAPSLQRASTLAVMREETGSTLIPAGAFVGLTILAWSGAGLVNALASQLG